MSERTTTSATLQSHQLAKRRVLRKYPSAVLCSEGGWYWVLLNERDSAPRSLRNPNDAWIDAARRANVQLP